MTYLTSETLKSTGVKTGRIKVDDNGEKKKTKTTGNNRVSETMRKTDSSQSFLEGLGVNAAQFTASQFYTVIAAKFSVATNEKNLLLLSWLLTYKLWYKVLVIK